MIRTRVFIVVVPHTAEVRYAQVKTHTPRNIPTCARTDRPGPVLQVSWMASEECFPVLGSHRKRIISPTTVVSQKQASPTTPTIECPSPSPAPVTRKAVQTSDRKSTRLNSSH